MVEITLDRQTGITKAPQMYMYNYGQTLHMIGDLPELCEAHFSFSEVYTEDSIRRDVTRTADGGTVEIPNAMFDATSLLSGRKYFFYVYLFNVEDEDSGYTFHRINVPVVQRPLLGTDIPDEELPDYRIALNTLRARTDALEETDETHDSRISTLETQIEPLLTAPAHIRVINAKLREIVTTLSDYERRISALESAIQAIEPLTARVANIEEALESGVFHREEG